MDRYVSKDLRVVARIARRHGWTIETTKRSHIRFTSPAGRTVFAAGTPSDRRGLRNLISDLRRAGLDV